MYPDEITKVWRQRPVWRGPETHLCSYIVVTPPDTIDSNHASIERRGRTDSDCRSRAKQAQTRGFAVWLPGEIGVVGSPVGNRYEEEFSR